MRSSEDLLKLIIAEAVNGVLYEAEDPSGRKPADQAAMTRAAAALNPEMMSGARAATETPTGSPEVIRNYKSSVRLPGGLPEQLKSLSPTIGAAYTTFTKGDSDPGYDERNKIIEARRESEKYVSDPVRFLEKKMNEGVTLKRDIPKNVSAIVIRDMLLVDAVLNEMASFGQEQKKLLKSAAVTGKIPSNDAIRFAESIRKQYSTLSRDKVTEERYDKAANEVLQDTTDKIRNVLRQMAEAAESSLVNEGVIVESRIRTQANALRPYMQKIVDGERKIKRIAGSTGPVSVGTEERTFRDSGTGNLVNTTLLSSDPGGARDVIVIPSNLLPSNLIDTDNRREFLPGELEVFDQSAAADFRLARARGYYFVAQALALLKMKDPIIAYYSRPGQNQSTVAKIENAFKDLENSLSKHPYGRIGISDAKQASVAFTRASIESISTLPALTLSDADLSAANDAANKLDSNSFFKQLFDRVNNQAPIEVDILKGVIQEIDDNQRLWNREKLSARINELANAFPENLDQPVYRVEPAEGSIDVKVTNDEAMPSPSEEGNIDANNDLEEDIKVFLSPASKEEDVGPFQSVASLTAEAVKKEGLGRNVEDVLNEATGDFRKKVAEIKEEQSNLKSDMYKIIDGSVSNPTKAAAVRAISKASLVQMSTPSVKKNVMRRVNDARQADNTSTPGNIFLTKENATIGALQLAIESSVQGGNVDSFTRYAIPYFGVVAGDPLTKPPKGSGRSKAEYLESLKSKIASNIDVYHKMLGRALDKNAKIVIPSMMKSSSIVQASINQKHQGALSLGIGRLVSYSNNPIVIKEGDITSQTPDIAQALKASMANGKSINVMSVTVQFPAGGWKIGNQKFDVSEREDIKNKIARLNSLKQQVGQASSEKLNSVRFKAYLAQDLPGNARDVINSGKPNQIRGFIDQAIDELTRESESVTGRGFFTKADVVNVIRALGMTQRFLDENVDVDDDGNLFLSKVAPAFLDVAESHTSEIEKFKWADITPTQVSQEDFTLRTASYAGGEGTYLPSKAIQLSSKDSASVNSPFNINRPLTNGLISIMYKTSYSTDPAKRISFNPAETVMGRSDSELKKMQIGLCTSLQEGLKDKISVIEIRTGVPSDDGSSGSHYPIVITVPEAQSQQAIDELVKMESFSDYFVKDEKTLPSGNVKLVCELLDESLDPRNRIQKIKMGNSNIAVGSMVYIRAMYEVISGQTASNAANKTAPPELYGVGRVTKIYMMGDDADKESFKTLLADVEFRGDQVKKDGRRRSIFSPAVTLKNVGCMFLSEVTTGGNFFNPRNINKNDISQNYPNTIKPDLVGTAGWQLPPTQDVNKNSVPTSGSGFKVGSMYEIVQDGNPMHGVVGVLTGFLPRSAVPSDLASSLDRRGMKLEEANAILDISGSSLLNEVQSVIEKMISKISGNDLSDSAVRQIFRKIDSDITQRYIKSPKNASGYASHGIDSDVIANKSHGAGAWDEMHAAGHAVHPLNQEFIKRTGRSEFENKDVDVKCATGLGTLHGCSAIFNAIIKHGPERASSAENAYSTEQSLMNPAVIDLTRADKHSTKHGTAYPAGLHTEEAVYFRDKSGIMRVGSPVGTSFRFKLDDNTGLEYTRFLRENMAIVLNIVNGAIDSLSDKIKQAQSSQNHPDSKVISIAQKILNELERNVRDPIKNSLDDVSSLGYHEKDKSGDVDTTKPVQNTLDAWHTVNRELASYKTQTRESVEDQGDLNKIKSLYTRIEDKARNLFGDAPVPTTEVLTVNDDGEIIITLGRPQIVSDINARNVWRAKQREVVNNLVSKIMNRSVISVDKDGTPLNVDENEDRVSSHIAISKKMQNMFKLHKDNRATGGEVALSWASDILALPSLGVVIDSDGVKEAIQAPTGSKNKMPGIVTSAGKMILAKDHSGLGTIKVIFDNDYMVAYNSFMSRVLAASVLSTQAAKKAVNAYGSPEQIKKREREAEEEFKREKEAKEKNASLADLLESLVITLKSIGTSSCMHLADRLITFSSKLRSFTSGPLDVARQSAETENFLLSVTSSLDSLVTTGSLTVVENPKLSTSPDNADVTVMHAQLKQKMNDITSKNERTALAAMTTFPSQSGTERIIETMKNLSKASTSDDVQRAVVPIVDVSKEEERTLNNLELNQVIPPSLASLVVASLRPV